MQIINQEPLSDYLLNKFSIHYTLHDQLSNVDLVDIGMHNVIVFEGVFIALFYVLSFQSVTEASTPSSSSEKEVDISEAEGIYKKKVSHQYSSQLSSAYESTRNMSNFD